MPPNVYGGAYPFTPAAKFLCMRIQRSRVSHPSRHVALWIVLVGNSHTATRYSTSRRSRGYILGIQ